MLAWKMVIPREHVALKHREINARTFALRHLGNISSDNPESQGLYNHLHFYSFTVFIVFY